MSDILDGRWVNGGKGQNDRGGIGKVDESKKEMVSWAYLDGRQEIGSC